MSGGLLPAARRRSGLAGVGSAHDLGLDAEAQLLELLHQGHRFHGSVSQRAAADHLALVIEVHHLAGGDIDVDAGRVDVNLVAVLLDRAMALEPVLGQHRLGLGLGEAVQLLAIDDQADAGLLELAGLIGTGHGCSPLGVRVEPDVAL